MISSFLQPTCNPLYVQCDLSVLVFANPGQCDLSVLVCEPIANSGQCDLSVFSL